MVLLIDNYDSFVYNLARYFEELGEETIVVRNQRSQEVLDALEHLRPDDREVVRLVMWEDLPHAAVGEVLGCSDRAVTMRLHRAVGRLRSELHPTAQGSLGLSARTETSDE